jgi:hypothetical protein
MIIARHGTLGRAAMAMGVTTSALSHAINRAGAAPRCQTVEQDDAKRDLDRGW